mgnify:FL=1
MSKKGFLWGAALGIGAGMLLAPKKGSETRRELKAKLDEMLAKLKDVDYDEVRENIEVKIYQIKNELRDLDKEKAIDIAKKKVAELQKMSSELVNYAVEKGTPVLQKSADAIREKVIKVSKEVIEKLEKDNNKVDVKTKKEA